MKEDKRARERARRILTEARKLISNQKRWCRHALAKDSHGFTTSPQDIGAAQFCAMGAVEHVAHRRRATLAKSIAKRALDKAARSEFPVSDVIDVNDRDSFTHKDVLKVFSIANKQLAKKDK